MYAFVGQRAFDGVAASSVAPVEEVFSCDALQHESAERLPSMQFHSLEALGASRSRWTSADVPLLAGLIRRTSIDGHARTVVPYSASAELAALERDGQVERVLAPPAALQRFHDDKRNNVELFDDLGLPTVRRLHATAAGPSFRSLVAELGLPFVVRAHHGSTGSSVRLIARPRDLELLAESHPSEPFLFERLISGTPVNVNAVVAENTTTTYDPSVQITGARPCTDVPFGFCGNDFHCALDLGEDALLECRRQTAVIGGALARSGVRGVIGVDFMVPSNGAAVFPLEINPRFQNSTSVVTLMTQDAPEVSPFVLHVASFDENPKRLAPPSVDVSTYRSQLIIYRYNSGPECVHSAGFVDGRYSYADTLCREAPGDLDASKLGDEEFIAVGSPSRRSEVLHGAAVLRVVASERIVAHVTSPDRLSARWSAIARELRMVVDPDAGRGGTERVTS